MEIYEPNRTLPYTKDEIRMAQEFCRVCMYCDGSPILCPAAYSALKFSKYLKEH
jgi:hypothetical protein